MKLLVFLPILTSAQFTSKTPFPSLTLPLSDQCFCKLEGQIDDCSCKVDTVDDFNNAKIYPRLASLLAKDYFRYFYYQPYKPCPFWEASSGKCSSSLCQVWSKLFSKLQNSEKWKIMILNSLFSGKVVSDYWPASRHFWRCHGNCGKGA